MSWPGLNSAATATLQSRRAWAWAGSGGSVGIDNINAVGTGTDDVADGVANDIVIAVLIG